MTDLETLKAMVAALETSSRPRVEWTQILFHAWAVLKPGKPLKH